MIDTRHPAMAANLTNTVWGGDMIVAKMDEIAPKAGRPRLTKRQSEQISN